jgi:hypothetical protein
MREAVVQILQNNAGIVNFDPVGVGKRAGMMGKQG